MEGLTKESATCRIVLDIIQSSKLYLRRRIQALLTARAHRTLARTHRTLWPFANFGGKIERFVSKIRGFVSKIQDFGSNFARAVRCGQCVRAVRAHSVTACSYQRRLILALSLLRASRAVQIWDLVQMSRVFWKTVCSFSCSFPMSQSLCRAGVEEVPVGTRKPPGKHSVVLLPLFLQSFCSPLFEAGFGLHGVDLRLCEDLFEPRCALLTIAYSIAVTIAVKSFKVKQNSGFAGFQHQLRNLHSCRGYAQGKHSLVKVSRVLLDSCWYFAHYSLQLVRTNGKVWDF